MMNFGSLSRTIAVSVPLIALFLAFFASPAHADLLDLRGQTLFLTGTVNATGAALGLNLGDYLPAGGQPIEADNPAKLVFASTGSADNSALTASFPLPPTTTVVNGTTYPGCTNPAITLTGSFNRTTGVFHMVGSISGTSVFDFGVYDTANTLFGIKRILFQVKNLRVTLDGTGSVGANGQFTIKQPGDTSFLFDISSNFFSGTPRVGLQTPTSCAFGGTTATVTNPTLKLSNWTIAQPVLRGTVTLQDCQQPAQPVTFTLQPTTGTPIVRTVTLDPQGAFGLFNLAATNYTVSVKGRKWLQTKTAISTLDSDLLAFTTTLLGGDVNNDNLIDSDDLIALVSVYNSSSGDGIYNDLADVNCDGKVDSDDLILLVSNYNTPGQ